METKRLGFYHAQNYLSNLLNIGKLVKVARRYQNAGHRTTLKHTECANLLDRKRRGL